MDEGTMGSAAEPALAPRSAAANIRRYLDAHRSDARNATLVVMSLSAGRIGGEGIEPATRERADPAVSHASGDPLRRHRGP